MAREGYVTKTFVDPRTGKRKYFYGKTEREVDKKIFAFKESVEEGRTFAEVAEEWWSDTLERIEYQTQKGYKPALRRALNEFGERPIKEIKPREISKFLNTLKSKFASKTLATQRMVISLIMDAAIMDGDIDSNPCAAVKVPKGERSVREAASPEDEAKIKAAKDAWLFPFFALMSGMRKGEILALQWKDIDFEENLISVSKSVEHLGNAPRIKRTKTEAGVRTVPLLAPLKARLLNIPKEEKIADAYIFSADGGKTPLTNSCFWRLYDRYREEIGVSCTAHQLRHSFATVAFEAGVPLKSVQEILGHRQLSTTMDIYTSFRKKALLSAADILNEKMG